MFLLLDKNLNQNNNNKEKQQKKPTHPLKPNQTKTKTIKQNNKESAAKDSGLLLCIIFNYSDICFFLYFIWDSEPSILSIRTGRRAPF